MPTASSDSSSSFFNVSHRHGQLTKVFDAVIVGRVEIPLHRLHARAVVSVGDRGNHLRLPGFHLVREDHEGRIITALKKFTGAFLGVTNLVVVETEDEQRVCEDAKARRVQRLKRKVQV